MIRLFGCAHILAHVGTGQVVVVLGLEDDVEDAVQVKTDVVTVAEGNDGPLGGYLLLQPKLEHVLPGQ